MFHHRTPCQYSLDHEAKGRLGRVFLHAETRGTGKNLTEKGVCCQNNRNTGIIWQVDHLKPHFDPRPLPNVHQQQLYLFKSLLLLDLYFHYSHANFVCCCTHGNYIKHIWINCRWQNDDRRAFYKLWKSKRAPDFCASAHLGGGVDGAILHFLDRAFPKFFRVTHTHCDFRASL